MAKENKSKKSKDTRPTRAGQRGRTKTNRITKITRHINKVLRGKTIHENDLLAKEALKAAHSRP